jgi:glutamate/tyrosine decarboxylase-like PLP-dependent enzyme
MNQKFMFTHRSNSPSLLPLKIVLKEAKKCSPPDTSKPQTDMDEQLALQLIENMKKPYRRPSLFAHWMGQPFPHEYREMVAADVR